MFWDGARRRIAAGRVGGVGALALQPRGCMLLGDGGAVSDGGQLAAAHGVWSSESHAGSGRRLGRRLKRRARACTSRMRQRGLAACGWRCGTCMCALFVSSDEGGWMSVFLCIPLRCPVCVDYRPANPRRLACVAPGVFGILACSWQSIQASRTALCAMGFCRVSAAYHAYGMPLAC